VIPVARSVSDAKNTVVHAMPCPHSALEVSTNRRPEHAKRTLRAVAGSYRSGPVIGRRRSTALLGSLLLFLAADGHAQFPAIYKCMQQDGRIEYSAAPCGPNEERENVYGDTFSVYGSGRGGNGGGIRPPLQPRRRDNGAAPGHNGSSDGTGN
jgi:hypothetical protein